jgi:sec-independent protein translocase protein TatA
MGALQPGHLVLILVIVLIVFGPGKLTSIGADMGKGLREFRKATDSKSEDAASTARTTTRSCTACAAPNAGDAKFCTSCGARFAA